MSLHNSVLSPSAAAKKESALSRAVDLSPLSVLIFHRETEKLKGFISILQWCGLRQMTTVHEMRTAIEQLVSKKYDIIFVTHAGEGKEATLLIEELKSLDATSDIPLVAITNEGEVKHILRILAKGVDEVIVPPLSRESIENMALSLLQTRLGPDSFRSKLVSAKELISVGLVEEARKIYLDFLSKGQSLLDCHLGLGEISYMKEEWLNAETHLKEALNLAKSAHSKVESHTQLARVFLQYGKYYLRRNLADKAAKCYETSFSLNPFDTEGVNTLLQLLQQRNDEDAIFRVIGEVFANFHPYSRATEEVALCLTNIAEKFLELNMPMQAKRVFEQLLKFPHGNVDVHLKVADFFLQEGLVGQVLDRLVNLLQKLKDSDILFKTGSIFLDIEKRYLSNGSGGAAVSGQDLSFLEDLDSARAISMAEKMFKQGLLLEPESPRFSLSLARCYIRQSESKTASEILEKLREKYGQDEETLKEVIEALLVENAYEHALKWIKDGIQRFPKEIAFYELFSRYHHEQGRPYDAVGCLKRALTIDPSHVKSLISLGGLYETIGEFSDAIVYYEKAIKLSPDDPALHESLNRALKMKYKKQ